MACSAIAALFFKCLVLNNILSSIYCSPAGRDYSKKKGYFRDEGEGPNFQATPAGQVEDSSAESAPCM